MSNFTPVKTAENDKVYYLKRDDIKKFLSNQPTGTKFYLYVRSELPIEGDETSYFPGAAACRISLDTAIKLGMDLLAQSFEKRGARLHVSVYENKESKYRAVYIGR